MTADEGGRQSFDLRPDPRILPMLGEITLAPWQCMAEFIDNAVDGFIKAARANEPIVHPEVHIHLPTATTSDVRITIADNGPGMDPSTLEKAVRAGWTGNDPVHNLGMFGMGFNIATARLATVTTVWTTRRNDQEWHGLEIDFNRLRRQGHFRTPILTRPKSDPIESGTEICIEELKPDQREWFTKRANHYHLRRRLGGVYAAMLRSNGTPISVSLSVNRTSVKARRHCIWDEDGVLQRGVDTNRHGFIPAYYVIDRNLPDRPFCTQCWQWLQSEEDDFMPCYATHKDAVVNRKRRVHGWIGLQRYFSGSEFGIDFLRHGRKLETRSKDLFMWSEPDSADPPEIEYPIDDPRSRGRIVGEIHLDHCRVTYMKDRFDRSDPAWSEMVEILRGRGPLRPDIARQKGYTLNEAPLFRLFQAYRRSSPQSKTAGAYARLMVVPDNDAAEGMAKWFHDGTSDYQSDAKWWDLVEEADRDLLLADNSAGSEEQGGTGLEGFPSSAEETDTEREDLVAGNDADRGQADTIQTQVRERTSIASLSQEYIEDRVNQRWNVAAFDEQLPQTESGSSQPWLLRATPAGVHEFLVDTQHEIFRSETLTPLDALLAELAHSAMDFQRGHRGDDATFSEVLANLRTRYARSSVLDPVELTSDATQTFVAIGRSLAKTVESGDAQVLFDDLRESERHAIIDRMATRHVPDPLNLVGTGGFLEYAPQKTILRFISDHPDLFFDGKYWDDAYMTLNFGRQAATDEARSQVLRHYSSLLNDALWLAEQEPDDLERVSRQRLLRASLALHLLSPEGVPEA